MADQLIIRGAREHNLKDVSLDLPARRADRVHRAVRVGQVARLAFDTIFAEGQRRYVESLSAYARQFLGQMDKPDVDFIEGLSPAVVDRPEVDLAATRARPSARSPRSTTTSALLFARAGRRTARSAASRSPRQTPQQIVDRLLELAGGHPVPGARAGDPRPQGRVRRPVPRSSQTQGFSRARVDGEIVPARPSRRSWTRRRSTRIEVVVDRLVGQGRRPSAGSPTRSRPRSALAGGLVIVDFVDLPAKRPGPRADVLREDGLPQRPPSPSTSSSRGRSRSTRPFGACPECPGLGTRMEVDPELVVPDDEPTPGRRRDRAVDRAHVADYFQRLMDALGEELGFTMDTPWQDLPGQGAGGRPRRHTRPGARPLPQPLRPRALLLRRTSRACVPYIERRHTEAESDTSRERFEGFMREVPCPVCEGARLKPDVAGGHARRQEHRRGLRDADRRDRRDVPGATSS